MRVMDGLNEVVAMSRDFLKDTVGYAKGGMEYLEWRYGEEDAPVAVVAIMFTWTAVAAVGCTGLLAVVAACKVMRR